MLKDVIKSEIRKGGKEGTLIWQSASTEKYKYLLANFLKCALFGMRTMFDKDVCTNVTFANTAEFLKTFLNFLGSRWSWRRALRVVGHFFFVFWRCFIFFSF